MKTFKRIKDLRLEQQTLNKRKSELKQLIHADWIEIKDAAKIKNILKGRAYRKDQYSSYNMSSWIDGLSSEVNSLLRKIVQETEETIEAKINDRIDSVLDTFFDHKVKTKRYSNAAN